MVGRWDYKNVINIKSKRPEGEPKIKSRIKVVIIFKKRLPENIVYLD